MNDKDFEKLDEQMMKASEPLRDKPVPQGILRGFAASVERRLPAGCQTPAMRRIFSPMLVPVFAVMILASLVVLRSPTLEYAQLSDAEMDFDVEIQTLKDLGAWDDNDDSLLGGDESVIQDLELSSQSGTGISSIA